MDTGDELSVSTIRRLACDAEVIPAVLGSLGEVLDVGRTQRLVTTAIWKALVLRDQHCRFPGCRRLPLACDAHHLQHWADGGPTSLDNLVLLCRAHHTLIHATPWQVRLNPLDRQPEFLATGVVRHSSTTRRNTSTTRRNSSTTRCSSTRRTARPAGWIREVTARE